jgi:hypothetical protein
MRAIQHQLRKHQRQLAGLKSKPSPKQSFIRAPSSKPVSKPISKPQPKPNPQKQLTEQLKTKAETTRDEAEAVRKSIKQTKQKIHYLTVMQSAKDKAVAARADVPSPSNVSIMSLRMIAKKKQEIETSKNNLGIELALQADVQQPLITTPHQLRQFRSRVKQWRRNVRAARHQNDYTLAIEAMRGRDEAEQANEELETEVENQFAIYQIEDETARREAEEQHISEFDNIIDDARKQEDGTESEIEYSELLEIEADEIARNGVPEDELQVGHDILNRWHNERNIKEQERIVNELLANAITYDGRGNITNVTLNFRGLNQYELELLFHLLKNFIHQTTSSLHSD